MGGALHSSPTKQVQKGKQKMAEGDVYEEVIHEEDDLHETKIDFEIF